MPVSREYKEYVLDQISIIGEVSAKAMFGGYGIYFQDRMFALIADDELYLKADDENRADFETAEFEKFRAYKDKSRTMSYYGIPADLLECPPDLLEWLHKSTEASERS